MTSPAAKVRGKKFANSVNGKIKKVSKEKFESETKEAEITIKMLIRQAHEMHKGFYKRRKSQSFVDLKTDQKKAPFEMPEICDGKGDAVPSGKPVLSKIKKKKWKPYQIKPDEKLVGKISKPPLPPKPLKRFRKTAKEERDTNVQKTSSASSVDFQQKFKPCNSSENMPQTMARGNGNGNSRKNLKILFEKELKEEGKPEGKKVLSPEEMLTNMEKILEDDNNEVGDSYSKTNVRFIKTLVSLGQKVLNFKPETRKDENASVLRQFSEKSRNSSMLTWESISGDIKEIWGEKEEIREIPKEKIDQELKSYRELKKLVNDELLRIWKPHEKVEPEKRLKIEEKKEIKPGHIILKPNPVTYLEKRALSNKTNCTSLIKKLDSEAKEKKTITNELNNWNVVKKLENAFETLSNINWEEKETEKRFSPKIKQEEVTQFILQRMENHRETILGEITKTEKKIKEKFCGSIGKDLKIKKSKVPSKKEKPLEVYFRRSLEDVQSSNGLIVETDAEKECKEVTQKIMDDFKNKKRNSKKSFAPICRIRTKDSKKEEIPGDWIEHQTKKSDPIDRKIRQDLKSLGLINHRKSKNFRDLKENRLKIEGEGKFKECSGWKRKKDRSRSISRSIGSEGPNEQALPPVVSLEEDSTLLGKSATDAKPLDTGIFSEKKEKQERGKPDTDETFSSPTQVVQAGSGVWNKNLEDPGGPSTSEKDKQPIFISLEEFKYRKGDPTFRHSISVDPSAAQMSKEEEEALKRRRELQKILHMNEKSYKFVLEEYLPKQTYDDRRIGNHRKSIIVDHNTSGERIDDNQTVLGHASKLIVKEDPEDKKTAKVQYYGKGIRRVSEPAYVDFELREQMKRKNYRKSMYDEPGLDIRRTESKDAECQTDSNDDELDDSDLFSIDEQ